MSDGPYGYMDDGHDDFKVFLGFTTILPVQRIFCVFFWELLDFSLDVQKKGRDYRNG